MTEVVAGLLSHDGRILICRRRADQPHPLKWEFPGGKVEPGETPAKALIRELREELGIEADTPEEVSRYEFVYPGRKPILLIFMRVPGWRREVENRIFESVRWEDLGRLAGYEFLEGDTPFILQMAAEHSPLRQRIFQRTDMTQTSNPTLGQILSLLAARRYSVSQTGPDGLRIQEPDSGIAIQAVLQGDILFLSLTCATVPAKKITADVMRTMLDASNGISTSHFQLHDAEDGDVTITLNNFCKLQELGADDEDDILSCVSFLLADVLHAKELIGADLQ